MASKRSLARLYQIVPFHDALLADRVRNRAFERALRARVRPSTTVLDIGSGTGLWAIAAARLGARRVVAVEKEPWLVSVIEELARENGVAERVEVVLGDSRRIRLGRRFDLIVSETVGNEAFDEGMLAILADARRRFLRAGGAVIPHAVALAAAPVRAPALAPRERRLPIGTAYFDSLAVHFPRGPGRLPLRRLAPAAPLLRVEMASPSAPTTLDDLRGRWRVRELGRVNAFAFWVEMTLAPGIRLSTFSGTHWVPTVLGVEPLGSGPGTVDLRLHLSPRGSRWDALVTTRGRSRTLRYSGLFAFGSLRARR